MKKFFLVIIPISFSISAFSQEEILTGSIEVYNHTQCPQYFVVLGKEKEYCKCIEINLPYASNFIMIPPAISPLNPTYLYLDGSNLGGNPGSEFSIAGELIVAVRIAEGPMDVGCFAGGTVGQSSCGVLSSHAYDAKIQKCELCKENPKTLATWKSTDICGETAYLVFTNI